MKKLLLALFTISLVGCNNSNTHDIYTFIEENDNYITSINYPNTNIKKLDKLIKKEVSNKLNIIKNEKSDKERIELNIDYEYEIINSRYINVALITYLYNKNVENDIKTFVFDSKENKILKLDNMINNKNIVNIIENNFKELYEISLNNNFTVDNYLMKDDHLVFYIKYLENIYPINIYYDDLSLKISIKEQKFDIKPVNYTKNKKVLDPSKKVVALTFDDGPSKYTKDIIDLLKEYDANGTFFVLGNKVKYYSNTLRELVNNGNEIGNHSYNHKWLTRLDVDSIKSQIGKTQEIIKQEINYTPTLIRPTYGSINTKIRNNTNLDIILWTVDTLDWRLKSSKRIAEKALKTISDGDIVLMHDTYEKTFNALKIILPKLKEEGYQFVTVSELKEINLLRHKTNNNE